MNKTSRITSKVILWIVAFGLGVYFMAFSLSHHHVPWIAVVPAVVVLAVLGSIVYRATPKS